MPLENKVPKMPNFNITGKLNQLSCVKESRTDCSGFNKDWEARNC